MHRLPSQLFKHGIVSYLALPETGAMYTVCKKMPTILDDFTTHWQRLFFSKPFPVYDTMHGKPPEKIIALTSLEEVKLAKSNLVSWKQANMFRLLFCIDSASGKFRLRENHQELIGKDLTNYFDLMFDKSEQVNMSCSGTLDNGVDTIPYIDLLLDDAKTKSAYHLTLPFTEKCMDELCEMEYLEDAPFGRGEATIVDHEVRSCLQVDASRLRIPNSSWLNSILKTIQGQLKLGERQVVATCYKLLIYQKGDLFKPHLDTQRTPNHFGTLIINLPTASESTGGELKICQSPAYGIDEKDQEYKTYKEQSSWVAFYTDAVHEILEVKRGYRISLVYHLEFALEEVEKVPYLRKFTLDQLAFRARLMNYRNLWPREEFGWYLGQQYTKNSLSLKTLKGGDHYLHSLLTSLLNTAGRWRTEIIHAREFTRGRNILTFGTACNYVDSRDHDGNSHRFRKGNSSSDDGDSDDEREHWRNIQCHFDETNIDTEVIWMNDDSLVKISDTAFDTGNEGAKPGYLYECAALILS